MLSRAAREQLPPHRLPQRLLQRAPALVRLRRVRLADSRYGRLHIPRCEPRQPHAPEVLAKVPHVPRVSRQGTSAHAALLMRQPLIQEHAQREALRLRAGLLHAPDLLIELRASVRSGVPARYHSADHAVREGHVSFGPVRGAAARVVLFVDRAFAAEAAPHLSLGVSGTCVRYTPWKSASSASRTMIGSCLGLLLASTA